MGQTLWILIGTFDLDSCLGYVARAISDYLTKETGIIVAFESAIVPKWKDSRISFKNVYISRRPDELENQRSEVERGRRAAARFDVGHGPLHFHEDDYPILSPGLVQNAEVRGVRGVLDRRSVTWDPDKPLNPADYRFVAKPGDFHLESLKLDDVLITVYQPYHFRPFTLSIFHADLGCLRKQWFCYDFLRADDMSGQIDNCLFSLHRPQSIGRTVEAEMKDSIWGRMTRFRIDGLSVDHLQAATIGGGAADGPIPWITSGKFDFVLDIKFPNTQNKNFDINAIVSEIAANISTVTTKDRLPGQRVLAKPALAPPSDSAGEDPTSQISMDVDLRFRDVRAAVPLFANELSRINSALIRPIVAFLNANHTLIPIRCHITKNLSDFDGSFTVTGLTDEIGLKVYDALAYHVTHANINRRVKTVSLWSVQQIALAIVGMIRSATEPLSNNVQMAALI
ncbi:mitochondrial distribution and morphology protein-domain-containing protein [Cantharellus anzutake]|uniref:mitochondrial distribution and morphology protein-domain-containing protein n=1 Tax=Cantharellus anzutake TaxID=1750568 RepID=UPI001906E042|nr:mitochondrial distribution and morphology protein-domain-containing protein [Cantharellus anzutake]KAF8325157.1 mitochondrial distribution and morphology protein-domain-containing protein [Cantharellus anzutake]